MELVYGGAYLVTETTTLWIDAGELFAGVGFAKFPF